MKFRDVTYAADHWVATMAGRNKSRCWAVAQPLQAEGSWSCFFGGRAEGGRVRVGPCRNAPRPILSQLNNRPISMKLNQPATSDGPQETGSATMHQRTMEAAAEQGQRIPPFCSGALCPATGAQETVAVSQELAPAVHGDARRWSLGVQTSNPLDPTGRDDRCNFGRWIGDERGGLRLQEPEPFPRRSESTVNRSYAEGLFCSFEQLGLADALIAAQQPCCSGRSLKLRYKYRTLVEPLLEEFRSHGHGIGAAGHRGLL